MAAKNKPYEQFGPYVLFKKLETDSLGDLWRAARLTGANLSEAVALRRITGGDRAAFAAAASIAKEIAPQLNGSAFVREQVIDIIQGTPCVAHEYSGGRSLRHITERARGVNGANASPVPLDQAVAIAEKLAMSLETLGTMRFGGAKLSHGAVPPHFVWLTDDGEIRVSGQMLGPGIVASLKDSKVAAEIGRYLAPEHQATGEPQKTSAVYSTGALLYLLITGTEPPDPMTSSAWSQAVRAARTASGEPMPDDLRAILDKSFVLDPAARYASIGEMKQVLSALVHGGGRYSATTFNLAFYLSNLLKKEMEGEAIDRERESKVNPLLYAEPAGAPAVSAQPPSVSTSPFQALSDPPPAKSRTPMIIAAALAVAAIGTGAYLMTNRGPAPARTVDKASAIAAPPVRKPAIVSEPIMASSSTSPAQSATTATAAADPAAQKKAFEDAVNQRLQAEMMKLQDDYTRNLQRQQSKNAPVAAAPVAVAAAAPAPRPAAPEERSSSAAQLDQTRRETARPESSPVPAPPAAAPVAAAVQQPVAPVPQPTQSTVREGDIVLVNDLDVTPHVVRAAKPLYPPMAARQRAEANVLVTVLVSENGDVLDAKVLRGDTRYGFEDAAVRAARNTKFSPATKDGKRVRTWFPLPFIFKQ